MLNDHKNTILAVVLSGIVLIGWQYFVGMPQEKARQEALQQPGRLSAARQTARLHNRIRQPDAGIQGREPAPAGIVERAVYKTSGSPRLNTQARHPPPQRDKESA